MKKYALIFIALLVVNFIFNHGLIGSYFQQDEWGGFGIVTYLSHQPVYDWFMILGTQHFFPLNEIFWFLMYKIFKFQTEYYYITALILHTIASLLVFVYVEKISHSKLITFITAVLFIFNTHASLAYQNLAVYPSTLTSFIFIMIFILVFIKSTKNAVLNIKNIAFLLGSYILALGFREDGLLILVFCLTYTAVYLTYGFVLKNKLFYILFSFVSVGYIVFRIFLQLFDSNAYEIGNYNFINSFLFNTITYPIKLIVQNIVDGRSLFIWLLNIQQYLYPNNVSFETTITIYLDLLFLILIAFFSGLSFFAYKKYGLFKYKRLIILSLMLIMGYALILSTVGRRMNWIESRYLYFSGLPVLTIVSIFLVRIKKTLLLFILILYVYLSYQSNQNTIGSWKQPGSIKKSVIDQIQRIYPAIPRKTIFFAKCKDECPGNTLLGLPKASILPFSSGAGWILLVLFSNLNENAYYSFFQQNKGIYYLWDTGSQDYKEINEYGFGYYYDFNLYKKTMKKYNLTTDSIRAFEYDSNSYIVKDITQDIVNRLKTSDE